jgi:hypothetical protein
MAELENAFAANYMATPRISVPLSIVAFYAVKIMILKRG